MHTTKKSRSDSDLRMLQKLRPDVQSFLVYHVLSYSAAYTLESLAKRGVKISATSLFKFCRWWFWHQWLPRKLGKPNRWN
jgi:hypothetical protein